MIAAGALGFQVISGRTLGSDDFAPVGMTWTVVFFAFTVLMIPAEQLITRQLTLRGGEWDVSIRNSAPIGAALLVSTLGSAGFAALTLDRFFEGNPGFIAAIGAVGASRGLLALGRGFLAGRKRFVAYGFVTGAEGAVLIPGAVVVALIAPNALAFVWLMAIAPLSVLLVRPFATTETTHALAPSDTSGAAFLGPLVVATGASQVILVGGPVFVGLLGGTAAAVSVYFVTFTLFRGPVTSSYNLIARILPDFTALAATGEERQLSLWASRLGFAGLGTTLCFGVLGYLAGPAVVELLYGSEFAPDSLTAAFGAAAVGAGLVGLFLGQVFVARAETGRMAAIWLVALAVAGVALLATNGDPLRRVATAFLVGELAATLMLAVVATAEHLRD